MKNITLFIALLITFSIGEINGQLSLGIKGGYALMWPDYGDIELPENAETSLNGFNLGLSINHKINKRIQIGFEPAFIKRGAACEPGWQPIFKGDSRLLLNYIELPVVIGLSQTLFENKIEVTAKAGYGFSRLINAYREEFDLSNPDDVIRTKLDPNDPFSTSISKYDHGFYTGLSIGFNLSNFQIFAESMYYNGLKNIDSQNFIRTRSLSVNTGLKIYL